MVRGLYIPADVSQSIEEREFASLEDYQAAVEGWIEPVDVPDLGITIYVNEEGLLRRLPLNSRVTFLWWYQVAGARQSAMLVGNAVIVGIPNERGDSTDVPAEVSEMLRSGVRFAIETRSIGDNKWNRDVQAHEYLDAVVWAMLIIERSAGQIEARIAPVT